MIKNTLEQTKRLLRISNNLPEGRIEIGLKNELVDILAVVNGGTPAIYLPWSENSGYYVDLLKDGDYNLFITAELTGCCVGVQRLSNGSIRVCHYNVKGSRFDKSDFERYNSDGSIRNWLIPKRYEDVIVGAKLYDGYSGGHNPTCFWGEKGDDNEWRFYYQLPNKEEKIVDFPY